MENSFNPKYTREQSDSCKLTDKDIAEIKELYAQGNVTHKDLSLEYNVCASTITYWLNSEYRDRKLKSGEGGGNKKDTATKYRAKKRKIFKDIKKSISKYDKIYYSKNRKKILIRKKEQYYKRKAETIFLST